MNPFLFAWRNLWREWRAGELRVLALALVVAVAAVSAVGFFTDRVRGAIERQAGELLAADRVVESGRGIDPQWRQEARGRGLATAETRAFRTVVLAGEAMQLVEVKAVGEGYPLRGQLKVAPARFAESTTVAHGPPPGEVWVDPRLVELIGVRPGEALSLGRSEFLVSRVLTYEPDRGGDLFAIAPRLLMHLDDLAATELTGTGALVTHRLLLAGPPDALAAYGRWLKPQLSPGERYLGGRDARPELNSALERGERFLGLAALVSVLLAGVAAAVAAHRHAARHLDAVAIMRCLGARQRSLTAGYLLQLFYLGLIAAAVGCAIGFAAQAALARLVGDLFALELPAPSLLPLLHAAVTALVALAGFAVPPLLALGNVPPLRVLRREAGGGGPAAWAVYGSAAAALLGLMAWEAQDPRLTAWVFAGALATLALLWLAAAALVAALRPLRRGTGVSWRYGLLNIPRRARASRVQVAAFGLGIMVLLLLSLVRIDLLESWRDSLPPDAPNQFLINVQPEQVAPLRAFFAERSGIEPVFYPMVRGRLTSINGRLVSAADYQEPRAKRLVRREFNLSRAAELAADNRIVAGRWWQPEDPRGWSVEEGLAETLGIRLGDRLTFNIAGHEVAGPVRSLRQVDWDSFRVNFFVVAPPGVLEGEPVSYITSFYLPADERGALTDLVRRFPNVTVIDVDALMGRVRAIIDRLALAVEFVFAFTLAAGLVVLVAAVQATQDERRREAAVLRTLGASRRQVRTALSAEFITLGLLSGLLAALAASALGWLLAGQFFNLPYQPNPWLFIAGITAGALGVGLVGVWGSRAVLRQPPLVTLREE